MAAQAGPLPGSNCRSGIHALLNATAYELVMDMSLIGAVLGAQTGTDRLAVGLDMVRMNAESAKAIVQVLDAANQNAKALAADGIGTNLDITA
jgi:hypothetical protein